jgi:Glycosyl hydrolase family 79, N-terminal domain
MPAQGWMKPLIIQINPRPYVLAAAIASFALGGTHASGGETSVAPADMRRIGMIDERFQSFNVEMVEVTGGRFWRPYSARDDPANLLKTTLPAVARKSDLFAKRSPIDLADARLRRFASALSPAYLRVSGTWANTTFFADSDHPPTKPPAGYKDVLTRRQWRDVIDFSLDVDAPIVTSFAISPGARDARGVWNPEQAQRLVLATRAGGGRMIAAEFMNEPDIASVGGAPAGYDVAAFARDFRRFHAFMRRVAPDIMILGPGATGRSSLASRLFLVSARGIDAVSYHHYGALSERCGGAHRAESALSEEWLARTDQAFAFYRELRDRGSPGKPIWLTETAESACGGNRWASTFLDTFRYLDQLGRLAKAGVQVVMHNTLAASDYGLLDEATHLPRPNFWGALLWRQLMGGVVLDSGVPIRQGLHVYAHCQRRKPGAVVLLVINNDPEASHALVLPNGSTRYTLDAAKLQEVAVRLNGALLAVNAADQLPNLAGLPTSPGPVIFAPATITFLTISDAGNHHCQ